MTKWKLVPTYPSKEMIIDGDNKLRHCAFADDGPDGAFVRHPDGGILSVAAYKAMLEAAPQPPKSEPIAYIEHHKGGDNLVWDNPGGKYSVLYTAPQPPSVPDVWRGLTDVEWMNIVNFDRAYSSYDKEGAVNEAVKRTEAKLKELNAAPTPAEAPTN